MVQTRSQSAVAQGNIASKVCVDEMKIKVWDLRNEMVGMKNVNNEKKEKITKKIIKVLDELEEIDDQVSSTEIIMDLFKFQWKFVLKGLITLEAFKNAFDHVYEHIDCKCGECIPKWLQVQVSQFYQDFANLIANFMLCEKCENFNKVLIEIENVTVKACEDSEGLVSILPSVLGMKVGKFTLLPTNPKTKDEYVKMIKYTLAKNRNSRDYNQIVFWGIEAIEYGFNFAINFNVARFKEVLISKMKEYIDDPKLNENKKARVQFLLEKLEPKVEVPKWIQKQTEKFFDIEAKNYQQATFVQKSESSKIPEQINKENKCLIDYREMPIGRARSLAFAKSVFMKKF